MDNKLISFQPYNSTAQVIITSRDTSCTEILPLLNLRSPDALFLIIGGADEMEGTLKERFLPLCRDKIAALAAKKNVLIVDGGTQSGIMEMMGQAIAAQGHSSPLLGVAPEKTVIYPGDHQDQRDGSRLPLDPHHSHFVLVQGQRWGDETPMLYDLAKEIADGRPVITFLFNGGAIAEQEILRSVQENWPIVIMTGSGRLADEIAAAWHKKWRKSSFLQRGFPQLPACSPPQKQAITTIVKHGDIYLFSPDNNTDDFSILLGNLLLMQERKALVNARRQYTYYEKTADQCQHRVRLVQLASLGPLVVAAFLSLLQTVFPNQVQTTIFTLTGNKAFSSQFAQFLPPLITTMVALIFGASGIHKWGHKWVLLRAMAETLKGEMYYYRTHTGKYSEQSLQTDFNAVDKPAEKRLTEKISTMNSQLVQAEINPLPAPFSISCSPPIANTQDSDDGFSDVTSNQYFRFRLKDQLLYYRQRVKKWEHFLLRYRLGIIVFGAIGGLLAVNPKLNSIWIPFSTILIFLCMLLLEHAQVSTTIMKYNQAATELENVNQWWLTLSAKERKERTNFQKLVESTEQILGSEQESWQQRMLAAAAAIQ